ncbi:MAG: helix-turn-helix domain-containing protein [Clostridiales bacterium]|nr:helix-turn-helix domain-containing protein [Clostridiales bacterium]
MECTYCKKLTGKYIVDKYICARCRKVLKVDMAYLLIKKIPIYLTENNRNKKGRKPKLTATQQHDIYYKYQKGKTMGKLASEYNVSKATIWNIIHKH